MPQVSSTGVHRGNDLKNKGGQEGSTDAARAMAKNRFREVLFADQPPENPHAISSAICRQGAKQMQALEEELTADGAVQLSHWALLRSEGVTGDRQDALKALVKAAQELANAIPDYCSEAMDEASFNQCRRRVWERWDAVLELIQPPGPKEDYESAFSMVREVRTHIDSSGGALIKAARDALNTLAETEADPRRNGGRWKPSELRIWRNVVSSIAAMQRREAAYDARKGLAFNGMPRLRKDQVDFDAHRPTSARGERPSKEDSAKKRAGYEQWKAGLSPRKEKTLAEREQAHAARERKRANHGGKQMNSAWVALCGMIDAKKSELEQTAQQN
jgi:hypothetical protein